ncbi:hypothetical protein SRABI83_00967 [Arthrobacter sp. Bi83]|nr:hypothetical protein SRABI83_00967 [Arthrobacter sp. Bi83]
MNSGYWAPSWPSRPWPAPYSRPRRSGRRLRLLLGGAHALGFFTLVGSVSPSFWLYAVVLIPVGLASITFLNSCNTSIQLSVEPQFRGRVLALYLAVLQGGTAVGAPLMGWIATELGALVGGSRRRHRAADRSARGNRGHPAQPADRPHAGGVRVSDA